MAGTDGRPSPTIGPGKMERRGDVEKLPDTPTDGIHSTRTHPSMLIRRHSAGLVVRAPAKVNLFLEVLRRRDDGYHELATLMVAVNLYDTLEFTEEPTGAVRLLCDHDSLNTGPDNLICRAAELVRRRAGYAGGVTVRLRKRIPLAAGLAGGSSDAAATLAGLNRWWNLGWDRALLAELAAELGSDVPFFFATPAAPLTLPSPPSSGGEGRVRGTAAWCTGRGERVEPLLLGRPLDFVLVCPSAGLSTAEVFQNVTPPMNPLSGMEVREAARAGDVEELGRRLHNRLQPVAQRLCPAVASAVERLARLGPTGQVMSGSGSAVFALCRDASEALRIARTLSPAQEAQDPERVFIVRSCI
jgi:4-diphosphocytidyl-2-C-methyl-D-erythritol kinase